MTSTIKANPASTIYTTTSGDSDVKITNRQVSGNATTNFTISFNVIVNTWGVADTNITIDLDNIIAMT